MCTVKEISDSRQESLKAIEGDKDTIIASFEHNSLHGKLEPVEVSYQSALDNAIRYYGEDSQQAIWRMNTIGTLRERYGRPKRAQDMYYRGWKISMRISGATSPVTQDFATEIVRVLRDRGVETELLDVVDWHARHGRDTLIDSTIRNPQGSWCQDSSSNHPTSIEGVKDTTVGSLPESEICRTA